MTTSSIRPTPAESAPLLQSTFLTFLPRIERHGRVHFRDLQNSDRRDDCVAEMVALSWVWFVRLVQRRKNPATFVSAIATFAARAVRSGRRLCGKEKAKDALSPVAQRRHRFQVNSILEHNSLFGSLLDEALRDNMQTPVPDQVCFRCDFPRWRRRHRGRDRRILDDLLLGERTAIVAHRYELSSARISQLRREFHEDWLRFGST